MKVKDLLKQLEHISPEMEVFCTSNTGEHDYCSVNTAKISWLKIDEVNDPEDEDDLSWVFLIDEK
jgi:hypothetical protein